MNCAPCNCGFGQNCRCPWRSHITQPLRVEVPWLYDNGTTTADATLRGAVNPDNSIDDLELTLDATGEEVTLPRADRRGAEGDLRQAAHDLWRAA